MLNQSVMQPECSICAGLIGQYCKMPNKWEDLNLGGFYGIVHNIQGTVSYFSDTRFCMQDEWKFWKL